MLKVALLRWFTLEFDVFIGARSATDDDGYHRSGSAILAAYGEILKYLSEYNG